MFKRWLIAGIALLSIAGGFASYQASGFGKSEANFGQLPPFSLPDTEGMSRSSEEWKGKVLVVNFWATWCPPCLEEIPLFMEFQEAHRAHGLQFVGVALEDAQPVREFEADLGINYPILVAGLSGLSLSSALGNRAGVVPFSVVVDREGRIVFTQPGIFDRSQIQEKVIPLL